MIRKPAIVFLLLSGVLLTGCSPSVEAAKPTVDVSQMTPVSAQQGPLLYCRVGQGSAHFGREWYDFKDTDIALQKGQRINVTLTRRHRTDQTTIQARFDGNGQKLIFCPVIAAESTQRIACSSLYALEDDLQAGIKRTFDIPAAVRGGAITCAYDRARFQPLTTPAAGGN